MDVLLEYRNRILVEIKKASDNPSDLWKKAGKHIERRGREVPVR